MDRTDYGEVSVEVLRKQRISVSVGRWSHD